MNTVLHLLSAAAVVVSSVFAPSTPPAVDVSLAQVQPLSMPPHLTTAVTPKAERDLHWQTISAEHRQAETLTALQTVPTPRWVF